MARRSLRWRCSPIKRALVLRGGALGDLILTLPIAQALRSRFDEVNIVANRKFSDLVANVHYALDDPTLAPFFAPAGDLPRSWCDYFQRHDLVLSYLHDPDKFFESNVRACGVTSFIAGPHRIAAGSHATDQLAQPLRQLGIQLIDFAPRLGLTDNEIASVRAELPLPLIALHPGSGSPRKNWPIENWIRLIDYYLIAGRRILIVGGEADQNEIARVRERFGGEITFAIDWPLRRLVAALNGATFVGHDSGISHLAAAAGAHCLILFGPTDARTWAPRNRNVRLLIAPKHRLTNLSFDELMSVLKTVREF